jgi:two-component system chemotaxis response regulator CheY
MENLTQTQLLIVDDSALNRQITKKLLNFVDEFRVIGEAINGIDAINKFLKFQPDVIIMDMEMPEMNGIDATKEIRKLSSQVVILGYSSVEDEGLIRKMLSSGANGYLYKPAPPYKIVESIRKFRPDRIEKPKK